MSQEEARSTSLVKAHPAIFTYVTKGFSCQASRKPHKVIWSLPKGSLRAPVPSYQLGFTLMLREQMGNITGYKEEKSQVLATKSWSGMEKKKIEENFVPFLINANLCNITQMVVCFLFFLKILSSQYISSTFNTVKMKQKHGRQSIAILNSNTWLTKDWLCVCVVTCAWNAHNPDYRQQTVLSPRWEIRRKVCFVSSQVSTSQPHPSALSGEAERTLPLPHKTISSFCTQ